jgi:hypothetical protein
VAKTEAKRERRARRGKVNGGEAPKDITFVACSKATPSKARLNKGGENEKRR